MRLIDADALNIRDISPEYGRVVMGVTEDDIYDALTIEPKHKHGHWYDAGSLSCRCSECGCKSNNESPYCPNCGSKMDGKEDQQ